MSDMSGRAAKNAAIDGSRTTSRAASSLVSRIAERPPRHSRGAGARRSAGTSRRRRGRTAARPSRASARRPPPPRSSDRRRAPRSRSRRRTPRSGRSRRPASSGATAVSQRSKPSSERAQAVQRFVARWGEQPHVDADAIVALAEGRRAERDDLAGERAGPEMPARHGRRGQRERNAGGHRRAFGHGICCRSDRDRRGASPGAGARGARRRDHVSNLPRTLPR